MSKLQVVSITPRAGLAKVSGKPYNMLIVQGVFTDGDGVVQVCELVFMEGKDRPLPKLQVGATYEPILSAYVNQEKKLSAVCRELRPLSAAVRVA